MISVRKLLCAAACVYLLVACSSDNSVYTGDDAQFVNDQSPEDSNNPVPSGDAVTAPIPEDSDNPAPATDDTDGQVVGDPNNPEPTTDIEIPTATLESPAIDQTIAEFPFEFSGTATDNSAGITAVDILVHNTVTMENLQADGTMGPYAELPATLDNPDENTTSWSLNVASLPPGPYYIAIRATNGASQASEWEPTYFFVASSNDTVPPTIALRSLTPDQALGSFPFTFAGEATDELSGVVAVDINIHNRATETNLQADGTMGEFVRLRAQLDNPGENTTGWSFSVASLPPGPYYIAVRAIDGESQVSAPEITDFSVPSSSDSVAPTATLQTLIPDQVVANFPFEFAGIATDELSGVAAVDINIHNRATVTNLQADGTMGAFVRLQAMLDNPGENAIAWSFSVASLPPGPYYIAVRAIDGESQVSAPEITDFSVPSLIDNVAPVALLDTITPDQVIANFPFEFTGEATDDFSGIAAVDIAVHNTATESNLQADGTMGETFARLQANLDNPGENTSNWSFTVTDLPPGPYYIAVRAIDGESQISDPNITNFSVPSSIDNVPPTVTLQSRSFNR